MNRPGLLVFGPQATNLTSDHSSGIRRALLAEPGLEPLVAAIKSLHQLWLELRESLATFDDRLRHLPCDGVIDWFQRLVGDSEADGSDIPEGGPPNVLLAPLTILVHVVQYRDYLRSNGPDVGHSQVLDAVKGAGVQGQCIGFLTAVALSLAPDETSFLENAAVAFRLAFCIGVVVDLDWHPAEDGARRFSCLAARCRRDEGYQPLLDCAKAFSDLAYASVIQDDSTVTLTVPATDGPGLIRSLTNNGFSAVPLQLTGRYHTPAHTELGQKLAVFSSSNPKLRFVKHNELYLPLRSNADGEVVCGRDLHQLAIRSILIDTCDWNGTLKPCLLQLQGSGKPLVSFGTAEGISMATASRYSSMVIRPRDFKTSLSDGSYTHKSAPIETVAGVPPQIEPYSCERKYPNNAVAIIGLSCKFPGADSATELWDIISSGRSLVREVPEERFCTSGLRRDKNTNKTYWGNFADDIAAFDHKFFKMSSREAASTDPQQRFLLQMAYQAIEDAGCYKRNQFGQRDMTTYTDTGCFIGCATSDYSDNVASHPPTAYSAIGTLRAFLSGRVSYHFGWSGPSITYDTACSSSMVAIHSACKALELGECSQALAGGVNLITSPACYQNLQAASFLSPTGPTKAFDAKADGYCRADGVGLIVLKKLQNAIENGDRIQGVITASAINQCINNPSITAPDAGSQSVLFRKVLSQAGLGPNDVSFMEAHGTGTQLGDRTEAESISSVFGSAERPALHLGSLKSNIGHTEGASGVAGLIKVLLMMRNRTIPPLANFSSLNPSLSVFEASSIKLPLKCQEWTAPYLAACVNNYGAAGSNAVVVVEQPPPAPHQRLGNLKKQSQRSLPVLISAASETSLKKYLAALCERLKKIMETSRSNKITLEALVYNLYTKKNPALPWTFATSIRNTGDLVNLLDREAGTPGGSTPDSLISHIPSVDQSVILAFGGQHGSSANINEEIFQASSLLQSHLYSCDSLLRELSLKGIFPAVLDTSITQDLVDYHCILFALQYSFAKTWIDSGVQVKGVIGHSFGQLTALCVAGCLTLKDALRLVAGRASLIEKHCTSDKGSMVAVEGSIDVIRRLVDTVNATSTTGKVEIACFNGPSSFVVAGRTTEIDLVFSTVDQSKDLVTSLKLKRLEMRCAFHSQLMDPILSEYLALAEDIQWHEPSIHLETCSDSSSWAKPSAKLIADHTRGPVYFAQAVKRLSDRLGSCIWLEAGVASPVIAMIRRVAGAAEPQHQYLSIASNSSDPWKPIVDSTLRLWKSNQLFNYWGLDTSDASNFPDIDIPLYQFDQSHHWLKYIDRHDTLVAEIPTDSKAPPISYISFLRFCDPHSQIAEFQVSPDHTRYKLLIQGHAVLGIPLGPLSLYTDLAIECSTTLAKNGESTHATEWIPEITELEVHAALGYDVNSEISMILTADATEPHAWRFEFTSASYKKSGAIPHTVKHATGHIALYKRTESARLKYFSSFERIVGAETALDIIESKAEQSIQGSVIYSMFTRVIDYGSYYKGLQAIHSRGFESVGQVELPNSQDRQFLRSICDPLELDNFLQVPGVHANCLREGMREDAYVTTKVEGIHLGPEYIRHARDATSWMVYSKSRDASDRLIVCDTFVFHPQTKKLAVVILGAHFAKVALSSLLKVLRRVNAIEEKQLGETMSLNHINDHFDPSNNEAGKTADIHNIEATQNHDAILIQLLSDILDIPPQALPRKTPFEDLGIDSLMTVEILNGIQQEFNTEISVDEFLELEDIQGLCKFLAIPSDTGESATPSSTSQRSFSADNSESSSSTASMQGDSSVQPIFTKPEDYALLNVDEVQDCFNSIQTSFDEIAKQTGFYGFWKNIHPDQNRLVLAYIAEAFANLDCPLDALDPGKEVILADTLPSCSQLKARLYEILRSAGLIELTEKGYLRTSEALDTTPSETIYVELLQKYPKYAPDHDMVHVTGPKLSQCMTGQASAVDLIFGSKKSREIVKNCYAETSIVKTANIMLRNLLAEIAKRHDRRKKIRILEIGAGTGGTTRQVVEGLTQLGINYSYDFTDISPSMVNKARVEFSGNSCVKFKVLDIEKPSPDVSEERYHVIISTNCIHATSNLVQSCVNMRKMLREDGMLALIEHTRNVSWFDLVFGLLDGWWMLKDGRKQALSDEIRWDTVMRKSGFEYIDWTDSKTRESQTIRIILGLPKKPAVPAQRIHSSSVLLHGMSSKHRKNLFAFPGGFGTASTYVPMPKLHDELALYGLNSAFLNDPDKFTVSFEEYASLYAAEIRRIQPYGPYSIVGYSVGGVVAYEAIRQMIEEGDKIEQLYLIDSACPLLVPPLPLALIDFLDSIDRFSGKTLSSTEKPKNMATPHIRRTLTCLEGYEPLPIPPEKAPPTVLFRVREGVNKQDKVPRPKVTPKEDVALDWVLNDRVEDPNVVVGWEELLGPENLSIVHVDGNHFSVMSDPHITKLADAMRPHIKL